MNYILLGFAALIIAVVIYRLFRTAKSLLISIIIFILLFGSGSILVKTNIINPVNRINEVFDTDLDANVEKIKEVTGLNDVLAKFKTQEDTSNVAEISNTITDYYVEPLAFDASSTTTEGSVKYGAIIVLGDLDTIGRSTYAQIRLKDDQEPGYIEPGTNSPREKRNEKINVDPVGWGNYKINGQWANNRCHLIGYQFSGLNDELRNLSIGTSYLNKGTESSGTDSSNPDGMLFYEQLLDEWLADNPENYLDLYVRPLYEGENKTPYAYYMQWIGFDQNNNTIPIEIGGYSTIVNEHTNGVILTNQSPSYNIDYVTGNITAK